MGSEWGPAYDINLRVFYALQGTISGWPGVWEATNGDCLHLVCYATMFNERCANSLAWLATASPC